jgi:hypothetical protein
MDFIDRLNADLDLEPTDAFHHSASKLDPTLVKHALTRSASNQLRA